VWQTESTRGDQEVKKCRSLYEHSFFRERHRKMLRPCPCNAPPCPFRRTYVEASAHRAIHTLWMDVGWVLWLILQSFSFFFLCSKQFSFLTKWSVGRRRNETAVQSWSWGFSTHFFKGVGLLSPPSLSLPPGNVWMFLSPLLLWLSDPTGVLVRFPKARDLLALRWWPPLLEQLQ
jgi:hypothetical protein